MPKPATKIPPDYLALPLSLPPLPSLSTPATHYLYIRRHSPQNTTPDSPPPDRSLFIANLPIDTTLTHLRTLFKSLDGGLVEDVVFDRKGRRPGAHGVCVFVDRESAGAALAAAKRSKGAEWPTIGGGGGADWEERHRLRFPETTELKRDVNRFMAEFGAREEREKKALARRRQEPDDDGFVTVTRGPKALKATEEEKNVSQRGELQGFYRFQLREKRKSRQVELLKEFAKDRVIVEERKRKRKFVPA